MVQAATRGVVDFTRADPRNPLWIRKLRSILDQIESDNDVQYYGLLRETYLAAASRSNLTQSSYDAIAEGLKGYTHRIRDALFPWMTAETEETTNQHRSLLREQWIATWGDPSEPETQARIEATVAAILGRTPQPRG